MLGSIFHMPIQRLYFPQFSQEIYIKRVDLAHPLVAGNKYFKLLYSLEAYLAQDIWPENRCLISFGGAYSNHLVALSAAAKMLNMPSIGIVRGDELADKWSQNPSLTYAHHQGMKLDFVSREAYQNKVQLSQMYQKLYPQALIIPEGGSNALAVKGIGLLMDDETKIFDYICTAVGTGATYAGLAKKAETQQQILGFQMVKDDQVAPNIQNWVGEKPILMPAVGKYGQVKPELIEFIRHFHATQGIMLDVVYTSRLMLSVLDLLAQNFFPAKAKILLMHTGGLQANAMHGLGS